MKKVLLEVKDIIKTFRNGEHETSVLKGIHLKIEQGSMIALQGVSGSRKSTLLNILGLLMRPTSGELILLDKPLKTLPFLFQRMIMKLPLAAMRLSELKTVKLRYSNGSFSKRLRLSCKVSNTATGSNIV